MPTTRPRPHGRIAPSVIAPRVRGAGALAAAAVVATAIWTLSGAAAPDPPSARRAEQPTAAGESVPSQPPTDGSGRDRDEVDRLPVAEGDAPAAPLSFEDRIELLAQLGTETARLASAGRRADAATVDARARDVFDAMMRDIADADCRALAAMAAAPPTVPDGSSLAAMRHRVLYLTLDVGLRRRLGAGDAAQPDLDALVSAVLTVLPSSARLARDLGLELLSDEPYLGPPHEPTVLELVEFSGEERFPVDVATALLSTLWHNLRARGLRSSEQLAGLALLLLDEGNASERIAAGRLLLADDRFRPVVVARMQQSRDRRLARELAMAAAQDLSPTTAFAVIAAASRVADRQTAPFLVLAHRDAGLLRQEYEQRLGDNVEPRLRALLIAGAGFAGASDGIELARLALELDPDPEVRIRALFALTARAAPALGEQAIARALDDPDIRDDPQRLGAVVLALENLARAGMVNAVDRLGQRLRACPMLSESSRATLEQLLADTLPGGTTSR